MNLEYKRFYEAERMFKSLSRTGTCKRELISIYMYYSKGDGLNTSLSRLLYLVYQHSGSVVVWLSGCSLVSVPCHCTVPVPYGTLM